MLVRSIASWTAVGLAIGLPATVSAGRATRIDPIEALRTE
jgi:hypothetical protein